MPTVLWNDRTTPLAVNSANAAFSSGLDLAWDFTDRDVNHKDGVPWKFVGATSPNETKTGTHNLTTLAGVPCRVPVGAAAANYDYTNATNYGLQTGSGDFTLVITRCTPASLPAASGSVEDRISGSAGTAISLITQEDAGNGWYLTCTGSTTVPLGTQQTAQFFGVNTMFHVWVRRTAGVVRILTQNATAQTDAVVRRSDATATTDMDATWAARLLLNFGSNVTCGLVGVQHWNRAMSDADINAIGKDIFNTQANTISAADTTAPILSSPTGTKTGSTTASGTVSTDEAAGTLYRLASTNATETAATIKAANLTSAVTATGVQNVTFSGLAPNTLYYAHYVQDDAASTVNTSGVVNSAGFTTDPLPAAVLSSAAGTATGTTTATATVSTTIGSGTLYYMVSANTTETASTIKASGASQAVSASGTQSVSFTGLTAATQYYTHFVQVANAQDSNVANGSGFMTASVAAPVLSAPSASAIGTTTATANVTTTVGSGTLYAYASANSTETAATVKASGTQKTVTATGAQTVSLSGLTPGTQYYLHFVHTASSVDSGVSNSASFTTSAVTVTFTPTLPLKRAASGALRTAVSVRVSVLNPTTDVPIVTVASITTHATTAVPPAFSVAGPVAGTSYPIKMTNTADSTDYALFNLTPA